MRKLAIIGPLTKKKALASGWSEKQWKQHVKGEEHEKFLAKLKTQKWRTIQGEISGRLGDFPGVAGVRAEHPPPQRI